MSMRLIAIEHRSGSEDGILHLGIGETEFRLYLTVHEFAQRLVVAIPEGDADVLQAGNRRYHPLKSLCRTDERFSTYKVETRTDFRTPVRQKSSSESLSTGEDPSDDCGGVKRRPRRPR